MFTIYLFYYTDLQLKYYTNIHIIGTIIDT